MLPVLVAAVVAAASREAALLDDARDGTLDKVSFAEASLIASGVPDAELPQSLAVMQGLLQPARQSVSDVKDPELRARLLLEALHERVFRSYRLEATTMPSLWTTGEFNCLSSSVAYLIAGEGFFTSARGVLSVRHALVQVTLGEKAFDVQTTVRAGFGMKRKQMLSPEYLSRIARPGEDLAVVERETVDAEEVPVISLIAGLYANRAVLAMRAGDNALADALLDKAGLIATGKSKARFGVWRASLVNDLAIQLAKQGRLEEAVRALDAVLDVAGPNTATIKRNHAIFQLELAKAASERGDWAQAVQRAEAAKAAGLENTEAVLGAAKGRLATHSGGCTDGAPKERVACLTTLAQRELKAGDREAALAAARVALGLAPTDGTAKYTIYEAEFPRLKELAEAGACDEVAVLGRKLEELTRGVTEAPVDNTSFVVQCFLLRSGRHFDEGAYEVAGDDLRRALALDPKNEAARANLAASEFNLAVNASNQGRCDEARAILGRGTPRSRWRDVLEPCWVNQTAKLGGAGAFDVALVAARHGLQDVPDSEALQKNLLTVQQSLAIAAARAQRCDEVKRWARELEARAPEFVAKLKRACQ